MRFHFTKMHGCGNDFIIVDNFRQENRIPLNKPEIQMLCDRHFGIGADGLVVLKRSEIEKVDMAWDFFNSDASSAEMCGNAARCVLRYASERHFTVGTVLALETRAGIIKGKLLPDGRSEVTMFPVGPNGFALEERILSTEKNVFQTLCVNTGVPHAVIEVKDLSSYPVTSVGRLLVNHAAFKDGSNITFYQRISTNKILSTTFERGVEEQTFACGTGATAAAVVFAEQYMQDFPVEVTVPGGDLEVDVSPISKFVLLRGGSTFVCEGESESPSADYEPATLFGSKKGKG